MCSNLKGTLRTGCGDASVPGLIGRGAKRQGSSGPGTGITLTPLSLSALERKAYQSNDRA